MKTFFCEGVFIKIVYHVHINRRLFLLIIYVE